MKVKIFSGERIYAKDNILVTVIELKSPEGLKFTNIPSIKVSLEIDSNEIYTFKVTENQYGVNNSVKLGHEKLELSAEEIEELIQKAEEFHEEDLKQRNKELNIQKLRKFLEKPHQFFEENMIDDVNKQQEVIKIVERKLENLTNQPIENESEGNSSKGMKV